MRPHPLFRDYSAPEYSGQNSPQWTDTHEHWRAPQLDGDPLPACCCSTIGHDPSASLRHGCCTFQPATCLTLRRRRQTRPCSFFGGRPVDLVVSMPHAEHGQRFNADHRRSQKTIRILLAVALTAIARAINGEGPHPLPTSHWTTTVAAEPAPSARDTCIQAERHLGNTLS